MPALAAIDSVANFTAFAKISRSGASSTWTLTSLSPSDTLPIIILRDIVSIFSHRAFIIVITFQTIKGAFIAGVADCVEIVADVAHFAFCYVGGVAGYAVGAEGTGLTG